MRGSAVNAHLLDRSGARKVLQRTGFMDESTVPLTSDPVEVAQLLSARWYEQRLSKLAAELGRDPDSVRADSAGYLREMAASRGVRVRQR
jgi:glycerol-3-phosphate O-acyltransferase